ncbi:hypothetical protein ASC96_25560 [Rhizobium sp. Root1204]|nr:hypothetical protein ASC96_25560 [Rhizobium sp. Root1204]
MMVVIEAMHLLPQSFEFQMARSSSQGRLKEQRHSSSQSLFGSFRKACRTSSRGRLFRFGGFLRQHVEIELRPFRCIATVMHRSAVTVSRRVAG